VHLESLREVLHRFPRTIGVHGEQELGLAMARLMLQRFGFSAIQAEADVIDARRSGGGRSGTRVAELHVPLGSPASGQRLANLNLPRGSLIVTIARDGEFVVPSGTTELAAGDALLVLANLEMAAAIERLLAPEVATEDSQPPG
jgi:Trk K+ transport system NAD-binding subunit